MIFICYLKQTKNKLCLFFVCLFLSIIFCISTIANGMQNKEPATEIIVIIGNDGSKHELDKSTAKKSKLFCLLQDKKLFGHRTKNPIKLPYDRQKIKFILKLLHATDSQKKSKVIESVAGILKKYYINTTDAISKELNLLGLELLRYLDVPELLEPLADYIVKTIKIIPPSKMTETIKKEFQPELRPSLAKYWHLRFGAKSSFITAGGYFYSIQDIIDYGRISEYEQNGALNLSHLHIDILQGIENLPNHITAIILSNNNLEQLTAESFKDGPPLKELYFAYNQLKKGIEPRAFTGLKNLLKLCLSNCNLGPLLEKDSFKGLEHVEELDLSQNSVENISQGILDHLTKLLTLHLSHNKLSTLPENLFRETKKLQGIYLYNNPIEQLPKNIFKNLGNLTIVSISSEKLDQHFDREIKPKISPSTMLKIIPSITK